MLLIKLFYSAKLKYWLRIVLAVFIQLFSSFPYLYLIVNTLESYLKIEFSIIETCAINFIAVIPQIVIFYLLVDRAQMKYRRDMRINKCVKRIIDWAQPFVDDLGKESMTTFFLDCGYEEEPTTEPIDYVI